MIATACMVKSSSKWRDGEEVAEKEIERENKRERERERASKGKGERGSDGGKAIKPHELLVEHHRHELLVEHHRPSIKRIWFCFRNPKETESQTKIVQNSHFMQKFTDYQMVTALLSIYGLYA